MGSKRLYILIVLFLSFAVFSCLPKNRQELLTASQTQYYSFELNQNYQQVYRKILNNMRRCYEHSMGIAARNKVTSELYHDIKKGNISLNTENIFELAVLMEIELVSLKENSTHVNAYVLNTHWPNMEKIIKAWVEEDSDVCK